MKHFFAAVLLYAPYFVSIGNAKHPEGVQMQSNSLGSESPNSATSASTNPSSGVYRRYLSLFLAVIRNLPKLTNVLPPFRTQSVQRLRERIGIPTRTHET
ncbi:MAG: hypothetical protein ACE1ZA_00905, partial [Pseudomonadales bacterium]